MSDTILVLNTGSSSIKFSLYAASHEGISAKARCGGAIEGIGEPSARFRVRRAGRPVEKRSLAAATHEEALAGLLEWLEREITVRDLVAVGHRVVHGGLRFASPVIVDAEILDELRRLIPLAPLHQPNNLAAIEALAARDPRLMQIACFDTAFHRSQPELATMYALPRQLHREGVRRYGFHGLSYEYIAGALPHHLGTGATSARVVVAHLGSGASMCAMRGGQSIATTMGFTALDGLPMSRRCGSLDPGVVLYLLREKGMDEGALIDLLYTRSGLFGVSGISDDMQALLASGDARAAEAIDLFVYRIGRELGSLAAALGGLDSVVFTAGIGEHAAEVRRRVLAEAAWLGLRLDEAANAAGGPRLTRPDSPASAWVIPTDEDLVIAHHSWELVRTAGVRRSS